MCIRGVEARRRLERISEEYLKRSEEKFIVGGSEEAIPR